VLTLRRATQAFAAAIGVGLILVTLACSDVGDSSAISSEGDGQGQLEDATAPGDENSSSSSTSEAGSEESSPSTTPEAGSGGVDAGSDSSTGQPPGLDTGTTPVSEAEGPDDSGADVDSTLEDAAPDGATASEGEESSVADVTSNDAASDVAQADSAAVDSSSSADSSDSSSSSGSLVPCTTAGQTNCVQCPGSTDGVCTTTEAIFVNIDITNHAVTSNTPDDNMNGCYQCMLNGSCIDSPSEHQSDLECEDLGTATFTDGTMPTQTGAAATLCDDAISCVVGTTGNGCALNAEGEAFCYCGSGPGSTIGDCDSTGSAVNGACLSTLTLGYKYTETDTSDVLPHLTDNAEPSGKAMAILSCAGTNDCTQCLQP
jgi:hypothetical protein